MAKKQKAGTDVALEMSTLPEDHFVLKGRPENFDAVLTALDRAQVTLRCIADAAEFRGHGDISDALCGVTAHVAQARAMVESMS